MPCDGFSEACRSYIPQRPGIVNTNLPLDLLEGCSRVAECATNHNRPWTQVAVTTRASHAVTSVVRGTKYCFHVGTFGAAGPSP